ncbi:hypothetical protein [Bacillus cereus group sp. RP43]
MIIDLNAEREKRKRPFIKQKNEKVPIVEKIYKVDGELKFLFIN